MNRRATRCLFNLLFALLLFAAKAHASTNEEFAAGLDAYRAGDFGKAAKVFGEEAKLHPAAGTLVNLGLAEWRRGHAGPAILAWEQARWIDPFNREARANLEFARQVSTLDAPELKWPEAVSARLPANAWAWIAGGSLWLAVAMFALPAWLRWRRTGWQPALAALALAVCVMSLPAHWGIRSRARIGFVLERTALLGLTPTQNSETVATLSAGEPVRYARRQGNFVLVHTLNGEGWVEQDRVGFVAAR
ncbi:MAG: hypothetical protein EPO07_08045 [Verrucomicrobia bacterium]|nr:MAG: hypothetical protein EPO07_08045 [Verrucomicrobiota bacterium]